MATKQTGDRSIFLLRWIDAISEVAGYLSGFCIFGSTLIICYAITVRTLGGATIWQTELTIYLLMFVTFVGGAYGLKHGHHVGVDLLVNRLPGRARPILEVVGAALALVIIVVVGWRSFDMWLNATTRGWTSGTAWDPPLIFPYAILPLGMALIALQYIAIVARMIRSIATGQDDGGRDDESEPAA